MFESVVVKELEEPAPSIVALVEEATRRRGEEPRRREAERSEWEIREAERKRAEAQKESRAELLSIIQKWSVAREFESFFQHLERGIKAVDQPDRSALLERLARARSIFGGIDRPEHFTEWLTPEEQLEEP